MMQTSNRYDNIHKAWLYRVLEGIASDNTFQAFYISRAELALQCLGGLTDFLLI